MQQRVSPLQLTRRGHGAAPHAPLSQPIANGPTGGDLSRTLGWPHLVALGVGAIVGTGILTLIGVGADKAGPAVLIAFLIAGLVCTCAALAYAEMATMIPATGGAYAFGRVVFGDFAAWTIGWCLLLEYCLVVGAVAVGWSGYPALEILEKPIKTFGPVPISI